MEGMGEGGRGRMEKSETLGSVVEGGKFPVDSDQTPSSSYGSTQISYQRMTSCILAEDPVWKLVNERIIRAQLSAERLTQAWQILTLKD